MIESGYGSLGETRISWREGDDTRDRAAGQILLPHLTGESSLICQNEESNSVRPGHSSSPSVPLKVTFVGIMPTLFAHCQHCMEIMHATGMAPYSEQLEDYPEDVKKQYFQLSEIAQKLKTEFGGSVVLDPVDSASPQGVWLSIRHRILRTPCILIQGNKVFNKLPGYEELRATILDALERSGRIASTRVSH